MNAAASAALSAAGLKKPKAVCLIKPGLSCFRFVFFNLFEFQSNALFGSDDEEDGGSKFDLLPEGMDDDSDIEMNDDFDGDCSDVSLDG